jgi:hypothetical protein
MLKTSTSALYSSIGYMLRRYSRLMNNDADLIWQPFKETARSNNMSSEAKHAKHYYTKTAQPTNTTTPEPTTPHLDLRASRSREAAEDDFELEEADEVFEAEDVPCPDAELPVPVALAPAVALAPLPLLPPALDDPEPLLEASATYVAPSVGSGTLPLTSQSPDV